MFQSRLVAGARAAVRGSSDAAGYHQVRPGETLRSIADRYGVDVDRLARANRLGRGDRIAAGQRLAIPASRIVHRVQPGETLDDIANRYRVSVSTIAYQNRLVSRRVEVGQRLVIPRRPTPDRVATSPRRNAVSAAPPKAVAAAPKRAEPTAPPVDTAAQERLARARSLVDRAVADYRAARFEAAIASAREAEDDLRGLGDRSDVRRLSARAAFVAGSAEAARGETDRASESYARVHALDPEFEPPSGWLSPRLEELFAEAKTN